METRFKNRTFAEKVSRKNTKSTSGQLAKTHGGDPGLISDTSPKAPTNNSADHPSGSMVTELDSANSEDNGTQITLQKKIQDALLSEEVISTIVQAVSKAILENVTNEVYKAINFDLQMESEKVVALETKVKLIENQLSTYQSALEDHEQYSRRNCLRIHGVVEKDNEKTDDIVIGIIREKLHVDIRPEDLDRSHRIPLRAYDRDRRLRNGRDVANDEPTHTPNPIIVKFARYNTRHQVYIARQKLKGSNVYIHEDLTRERNKLVYQARTHDKVKKVWTNDGRISVLTRDEKKVKIRTFKDLERL